VRAFQPDIIFGIFLYPAGYTALKIGKKVAVPVVVKAVGSDLHSIGDCVSAAHTRTVLKQADFVVTASEDLRRRAIAMGAPDEKCKSNINGCNVAIFRPGDRLKARRRLNLDYDAPSVVYIGRMDERKGLFELVTAAKELHSKRPNLRFYMVGEGPDRNKIVKAIEVVDATGYIKVLPACSPEEVALWMTAADVVTLPSYMEGCPNVVLEALACGRPVVATEVGGIPELMNDTCGRLIPPRDAGALADALNFVLDREWDAGAISARWGRGWDTVAAELLTIFESLTRG
jgi:glycosyltransferase involved in cell wall biosynthesis